MGEKEKADIMYIVSSFQHWHWSVYSPYNPTFGAVPTIKPYKFHICCDAVDGLGNDAS